MANRLHSICPIAYGTMESVGHEPWGIAYRYESSNACSGPIKASKSEYEIRLHCDFIDDRKFVKIRYGSYDLGHILWVM